MSTILRKEATKDNGQRSPGHKLKTPEFGYKLSHHLRQLPKLADDFTINLQNHYIDELDPVAPEFHAVEKLVLNGNKLHDLSGIEQFKGVKRLMLCDNELVDILNVYHLFHLKNLEELDFRGNDIQQQPYYRETLMIFLPKLRTLDGKPVRSHEREAIDASLINQYALLDKLVINYCELLKLQDIAKKLEINKQLFTKDKRFLINYSNVPIDKLRKMYRIMDTFDERILNMYRRDLLRDVHTIESTLLKRDDMETAASELINRQQAKIQELIKFSEKKANILATVHTENIAKLKKYEFDLNEDFVLSSPLRETGSIRSVRSGRSDGFKSFNTASNKKLEKFNLSTYRYDKDQFTGESLNNSMRSVVSYNQGKTSKSVTKNGATVLNKSINKSRMSVSPSQTRSIEPTESQSKLHSPSNKELYNSYKRMTEKAEDSVYLKATSPNTISDRPFETFQSQIDSPSAKENVDKERQINRLAKSLKQKVEEVIQVEDLNKQLKDRLKAYQSQNEENIKIAQDEIKIVNIELDKALISKNDLERELKHLRRDLEDLGNRHSDLEHQRNHIQQENNYLRDAERELQSVKSIEEKYEYAYKIYEQKLQSKVFLLLRRAADVSRRFDNLLNRRQERKELHLKLVALKQLQRNVIINKIIKLRIADKNTQNLAHKLQAWKMFTRTEKFYRFKLMKKNTDTLANAFIAWQDYSTIRKRKRNINKGIQEYYITKLLRESLNGFKINWKLYHLPKQRAAQLERKAIHKLYNWNTKLSFLKWKVHVRETAIPKTIRNKIAAVFYKKKLLRLGFTMFISNFNRYYEAKERAELMRRRYFNRIVYMGFFHWKNYLSNVNKYQAALKKKGELYLSSKKYIIWRQEFMKSQKLKLQEIQAREHYESLTKKRIFIKILNHFVMSRNRKVVYNKLKEKFENFLVTSAYSGWRQLFKTRIEERQKAQQEALELQDKYYTKWAKYLAIRRDKHRKTGQAHRQLYKTAVRNMESMFKGWKTHTKKKLRREKLDLALSRKSELATYKEIFEILKLNRLRNLKTKYVDLYTEHEGLKSKHKANIEYTNDADTERIQLINNLDTLSSTIDHLRQELASRDNQITDLKDNLRFKTESEDRLTKALQTNIEENDRLSRRLNETSDSLTHRNFEYDRLNEQSRLEKDKLIQTCQQLQSDNERKQEAINELQAENRNLGDTLTRVSSESESRLKSLDSESRQLRETLRSRTDELNSTNDLLGRFERSNNDLKSKLAVTYSEAEAASMRFQDTIQNLEVKNHSLHDEISMLKKDKDFQAKEIFDLKEMIRSYEAQIEKMTEAQHKDTEDFLESIHRSKSRERERDNTKQREFSFKSTVNPIALSTYYQPEPTDYVSPKSDRRVSPKATASSYYVTNDYGQKIYNYTDRLKKSSELDTSADKKTFERPSFKGAIKHQQIDKSAIEIKTLKTEPWEARHKVEVVSPTSPIQDIQRNIEKLKQNKKNIMENIEQRTKNLRESFTK